MYEGHKIFVDNKQRKTSELAFSKSLLMLKRRDSEVAEFILPWKVMLGITWSSSPGILMKEMETLVKLGSEE